MAALLGGFVWLAGCGLSIPADPEGTLDRVRGGVLRVGVSPNPPWTVVSGPEAQPACREVELVQGFADGLGARVEWSTGGEEPLMKRLKEGQLDMVIGGLTAKTPWTKHAAVTRPYASATGVDGKRERHVMAARMGENAFLVELERHLLSRSRP